MDAMEKVSELGSRISAKRPGVYFSNPASVYTSELGVTHPSDACRGTLSFPCSPDLAAHRVLQQEGPHLPAPVGQRRNRVRGVRRCAHCGAARSRWDATRSYNAQKMNLWDRWEEMNLILLEAVRLVNGPRFSDIALEPARAARSRVRSHQRICPSHSWASSATGRRSSLTRPVRRPFADHAAEDEIEAEGAHVGRRYVDSTKTPGVRWS